MSAEQSPLLFITIAVLSYLLGSIPFGLLLTRAAGLGDIRKIGSGGIGATNVLRTGHKGIALATVLLDAAKGTLAVVIADIFIGSNRRTIDFSLCFFCFFRGLLGGELCLPFLFYTVVVLVELIRTDGAQTKNSGANGGLFEHRRRRRRRAAATGA